MKEYFVSRGLTPAFGMPARKATIHDYERHRNEIRNNFDLTAEEYEATTYYLTEALRI